MRAGFTPKYQDIPTLTTMLTYSYAPISEQKMHPGDWPRVTPNEIARSSHCSVTLYDPPIEEFSVLKTDLIKPGAKFTFAAIKGPSILICTKGKGSITVGPKKEEFREGYVYFVGAWAEFDLESESEDFTTFHAFCELEGESASL